MKDDTYIQCLLKKGEVCQTSWLPKKFAVVGRLLDLDEDPGRDKGWHVEQIFPNSVRTHAEIIARSQDYKKTRAASDI